MTRASKALDRILSTKKVEPKAKVQAASVPPQALTDHREQLHLLRRARSGTVLTIFVKGRSSSSPIKRRVVKVTGPFEISGDDLRLPLKPPPNPSPFAPRGSIPNLRMPLREKVGSRWVQDKLHYETPMGHPISIVGVMLGKHDMIDSQRLEPTMPEAMASTHSPVFAALDQVTKATLQVLRAAKDTGSSSQDKDRCAKIAAMIAKAANLKETIDLADFPEAKAACDAVTGLSDINTKLTEAQVKIKAAPAKTEEADQAQANIDALRAGLDTMIPPLDATLTTMETLLMAAAALDEQFLALSEQVKGLEGQLKSDKERLSAISKAVEQAAKLS